MSYCKKNIIIPKQACSVTEGLSQNIVLRFVIISYTEEYFSTYLVCKAAFPHI